MRIYLFVISDSYLSYFTSSKTTLTDYQCVSTGCCTHVAKTKITIDNQHVTKSLQRYKFLPKQPKENTENITNLSHFLVFGWVKNAEIINIVITKICQYCQVLAVRLVLVALNICHYWHFLIQEYL